VIQLCASFCPNISVQLTFRPIVLLLVMFSILGHMTVCTSNYGSDILCGSSCFNVLVGGAALVVWLMSVMMLAELAPVALGQVCKVTDVNCQGYILQVSSISSELLKCPDKPGISILRTKENTRYVRVCWEV
jgi:hypothetical protein